MSSVEVVRIHGASSLKYDVVGPRCGWFKTVSLSARVKRVLRALNYPVGRGDKREKTLFDAPRSFEFARHGFTNGRQLTVAEKVSKMEKHTKP